MNLTSVNLSVCNQITGKNIPAHVFCGPVREKIPRKFRLSHSSFSQLHSGDLGALSGLLQLEKVDLFNCGKITGKEDSHTVLLRTSPRAPFRE